VGVVVATCLLGALAVDILWWANVIDRSDENEAVPVSAFAAIVAPIAALGVALGEKRYRSSEALVRQKSTRLARYSSIRRVSRHRAGG
jgi:hypothetical protein